MKNKQYDIITIGGSAGSIAVISAILNALPDQVQTPVVIILHRLRNVQSEMGRLLSSKRRIIEPEDKEAVKPRHIYLAPQNYHLMLEADKTFMLDYSELVNYSRPSIDMTFSSVAEVYGSRALAILLSGANRDGAAGMCDILAAGGTGIVQDPASAAFETMPQAALEMCKGVYILSVEDIIEFIINEP
ncbi:chemotaxis protein CheB [Chitinophaga sp.]|uniref:chemotaxis protein CheB n=1 Tax=Chitinophaga sp. TaxID=1869181 RepID=UPI0031E00E11